MSLAPNTKLGSYELLVLLGAGGMGEVYRARDSKLGREVAIKLLPETYARNPERLARFEREARVLASLNHPNIATLYGVEQVDDMHFLVMELADGETLADRCRRGAIPVEDALPIFEQIAQGLEAAHGKGILHRDLKPANIKVGSEGKVKLLDFGLAKALGGDPVKGELSESPTITRGATETGVILGTAPYMSPEQARGKPLDKRSDMWAFGCVFFEALSGRPAYAGDTVTDVLAAVVTKTPDWTVLPGDIPWRIRDLLRSCLAKDIDSRLRDAGDARIAIQKAGEEPESPAAVPTMKRRHLVWQSAVWLATVALTAAAVWILRSPEIVPENAPLRLSIQLPATAPLDEEYFTPSFAISPDGTRLVYVAQESGTTRLRERRLDEFDSRPIAGTEGAFGPFFSPDGEWVGFFADGNLKKVPLEGGTARTLSEVPTTGYTSGSWGEGRIFVGGSDSIFQVSENGGPLEAVTQQDPDRAILHYLPRPLPDGRGLIFSVNRGGSSPDSGIAIWAPGSDGWRVVLEGGSCPLYLLTGHLLYARAGSLLAVPFDLDRLQVSGTPIPVLNGVLSSSVGGFHQFDVSQTGTLVFAPGGYGAPGGDNRSLMWVNRNGVSEPVLEERRSYETVQFSPDGSQLALTILEGPTSNVWLYDVERGTLSKKTFEESSIFPVWTPDGKTLTFASNREGAFNLYWQPTEGGPAQRLAGSQNFQWPYSWSPDGQTLLYTENMLFRDSDIYTLSIDGQQEPQPLLHTSFNEDQPRFSPDGKWLTYTSEESGRSEVYLQSFPEPTTKHQISIGGGIDPIWRRDGKELFFRNDRKIMAVSLGSDPRRTPSRPELLFEGQYKLSFGFGVWYDIAPDGERFAMTWGEVEAPTQINLVLNWHEELKRLVPTD